MTRFPTGPFIIVLCPVCVLHLCTKLGGKNIIRFGAYFCMLRPAKKQRRLAAGTSCSARLICVALPLPPSL